MFSKDGTCSGCSCIAWDHSNLALDFALGSTQVKLPLFLIQSPFSKFHWTNTLYKVGLFTQTSGFQSLTLWGPDSYYYSWSERLRPRSDRKGFVWRRKVPFRFAFFYASRQPQNQPSCQSNQRLQRRRSVIFGLCWVITVVLVETRVFCCSKKI